MKIRSKIQCASIGGQDKFVDEMAASLFVVFVHFVVKSIVSYAETKVHHEVHEEHEVFITTSWISGMLAD